MEHYTSGSPRVHACAPLPGVLAAIEEYERRGKDGTLSPALSRELLDCAADLREEVTIRERERRS